MKTKLNKLVPSAWRLVLGAALCAVGLSAFAALEGSEENPWQIGAPNAADVTAWTNGTGKLVIEGTGKMMDWSEGSEVPWGSCKAAITSAEIAAEVTSIGKGAFYCCERLSSVEIPASVTDIGLLAFNGCTVLSNVTFAAGSKLAAIGETAFNRCDNLGRVEIPVSVTNIGEGAFSSCASLSNVTVRATVPPTLGDDVFWRCGALAAIYVPYGTGETYKGAEGWRDYADKIAALAFALRIPAATAGYSYVVSNATDEIAGEFADGTNTYMVARDDTAKVYFTLAEGYAWAGAAPTNPMDLGTITDDVTVDEGDLPKASSKYTLTYKPGEGTGEDVVSNLVYGVEHEVIGCPFAKDHYAFAGWTDADGRVYQPGDRVSDLTDEPGGNVDFTAVWEEHEFEIVIPELRNMACRVYTNEVEISPSPYFVVTGVTAQVVFEATGDFLLDAAPSAVKAVTNAIAEISCKVTFGTPGYPLPVALAKGNVKNPWPVAVGSDMVPAWTNGTANLVVATSRVDIAVSEFVALTNGMGRLPDTFSMILPDGSEDSVRLLVEKERRAYATLGEALSAEPLPETLRLYEVDGYRVSYDKGEDGQGEPSPVGSMATDLFYPTIATNLTANAFRRANFVFDHWLGSDGMAYADRAEGSDFALPGETLALTAMWTRVIVPVSVSILEHTTASVTTNGQAVACVGEKGGCRVYNVATNADVTIVYRADSGWAFDASGTDGTVVLPNVAYDVEREGCFVPAEALPTVVPVADIVTVADGPDGKVVVTGSEPTADGVLVIPGEIGGKGVFGVADKAFQYATWLRELVVGEGVVEIGNATFDSCTGLRRVSIPASVKRVGQIAFMRCFALEQLEFKGDAPAMQKLANLDYGICWGAHGFTVKTASGTKGWNADSLGALCAGWQTFSGPADGVYACTYDSEKVIPRITGLARLTRADATLTVSNVKKGLIYRLMGVEKLGDEWRELKKVEGGDSDTLVFTIPSDTGTCAFFRVTVGEE